MINETVRIVLVDDHKLIRESWKMLLENNSGIEVVGDCDNGYKALELIRLLDPDILLVDINMSPVNGFEAARKILKQNPSIRIIALSLHRDASYCRNMLQLGAKGYVTKSSPYGDIIDAINAVAAGGNFIDKNITGMV